MELESVSMPAQSVAKGSYLEELVVARNARHRRLIKAGIDALQPKPFKQSFFSNESPIEDHQKLLLIENGMHGSACDFSENTDLRGDIKKVLGILALVCTDDSRAISMVRIVDACCLVFNISKLEMTGPDKRAIYAIPRQIAMALTERLVSISLYGIGERINRDHSTVLFASRKYQHMMDEIFGVGNGFNKLRYGHTTAAIRANKGRNSVLERRSVEAAANTASYLKSEKRRNSYFHSR